MTREGPSSATLGAAVAAGILAVSTAAVLVRWSTAPPMAIAFYRLAFATAILGAWTVAFRREELRRLARRDVGAIALAGALLALHFAAWITSLAYTTVAASLFLVTTHPILVALASHGLGERLRPVGWIGLFAAFGGAAVILGTDAHGGERSVLGDALALVGGVAFAGYFLVARGVRQRVRLLPYATMTYGVASLFLLGALVAFGEPLAGYAPVEYGLFLALAAIPMIGGHTVLNWAIRYLPAPVVSATVLGEPVAGTLLAFAFLGEVPHAGVVLGGLLVIAGIGGVVRGQEPRARAPRRAEGEAAGTSGTPPRASGPR